MGARALGGRRPAGEAGAGSAARRATAVAARLHVLLSLRGTPGPHPAGGRHRLLAARPTGPRRRGARGPRARGPGVREARRVARADARRSAPRREARAHRRHGRLAQLAAALAGAPVGGGRLPGARPHRQDKRGGRPAAAGAGRPIGGDSGDGRHALRQRRRARRALRSHARAVPPPRCGAGGRVHHRGRVHVAGRRGGRAPCLRGPAGPGAHRPPHPRPPRAPPRSPGGHRRRGPRRYPGGPLRARRRRLRGRRVSPRGAALGARARGLRRARDRRAALAHEPGRGALDRARRRHRSARGRPATTACAVAGVAPRRRGARQGRQSGEEDGVRWSRGGRADDGAGARASDGVASPSPMPRLRWWAARLLVTALPLLLSCRSRSAERPAMAAPAWLLERARQEAALAAHSSAFHDFRFTDQRDASGITFVNRVVDDAGKAYKKVHYDHGTGLCAADVDGDGRPDLYFVTQLGTNELWRNLGGGRFENLTDRAGLRMPDAIAAGCAFADIDNDGLPDLFVTTVRHGNRLFKNLGGGKFRDITAAAGVGYVGHSSGAVFFDYDGDGLLDLFVTNVGVYTTNQQGPGGYYIALSDAFLGHLHPERAEASILYHNLGGNRFKDVSRKVGLVDSSWSGDATSLDVNDDGFPDLYILDMQGENHLWLNEAGKRFRDVTRTYFPKTPWGAMGVKAFDFDGDGRFDLLVTDMHSDMWVNIPPGDWAAEGRKADSARAPADYFPGGKDRFIFGNALFANQGGGKFAEVSDSVGVETYWPWGPSVDDLNADGWDDIFITAGMNFPHRYGINSVFLNEQGRHFLPSEFVVGVEPRPNGVLSQDWFTLECNGADRGNPLCACNHPPTMVIE